MTGKQLKNSILQWAIQGKLVPQDPNDEPASVLLERIRAEKARLIKEKKIKKPKNESIIYRGDDNSHYEKIADGTVRCIDDEIPFEIPESWQWARLSSLTQFVTDGDHQAPPKTDIGIPFVVISDISKGQKEICTTRFVPQSYYDSLSQERKPQKGDILFSVTGSYGIAIENNFDSNFCFQRHIALIRPLTWSKYLCLVLQSDFVKNQCDEMATGMAQKTVGLESLRNFIIPVPPFSEQHRIVEKLKSVLPLVEKYNSHQSQVQVCNASIIEILKKSILQEAIQGKLVPQCSEDEPTSALLHRIKAEKERLIKEKKIKRDKSESVIFRGDDNCYFEKLSDGAVRPLETPFDIPDNWEWVRLGDLVYNCSGLSYKKDDLEVKHTSPIRVLRGGNIGEGFWLPKDDDVKIAPQFVKPELLLKAGTFITPAVSSYEQVGKTGLIEIDQEDTVVGGFVLMLIPFSSDKSFLRYLLYLFQSPFYKAVCQSIVNKSGQAFYNLSRTKLMNAAIPLPPLKEQCRIVEYLDAAFTHIR